MQNNQYLTEENYQKTKKKLKRLSLAIFLAGLIIGGGLITTGIILAHNTNQQNAAIIQEIQQNTNDKNSQLRTENQIQADIDAVQAKINTLNTENDSLSAANQQLRVEQQQFFMEDSGFSERYTAKEAEISQNEAKISGNERELITLIDQLSDYRYELSKIKSGVDDTKAEIDKNIQIAQNTFPSFRSVLLYAIGGFIIFICSIISLGLYVATKRREIAAFTAQQYMPVAQEGINTMTPTIGNAAGTVAENVTRGIKNGLSGSDTPNRPTTPPKSQN